MSAKQIILSAIRYAAIVTAAVAFACCDKDPDFGVSSEEEGIRYTSHGNREPIKESRRVLLFYECGFNSLYSNLAANMEVELPSGNLPGGGRHDDVVLVFSKIAKNLNYKDVPSYLRRIYKDAKGETVSDTLKIYPESTVASSGATMRDVLSLVKSTFPAKSYGMVFSSHGSGWLPAGYYYSPYGFERDHGASSRKLSKALNLYDIPQGTMADDPYARMVRSIGQDEMYSGDVEMDVTEFAEGIPFHLDYLLFDMCLSGGIEIAYALKDKADYLGISPAEVLAAGTYDYTKITQYLFKSPEADLQRLFKDSFDRYDKNTGDMRSSTVTLLRTNGLDNLATVCKALIDKYRNEIANAPTRNIQGYFRENRHYFYDLEDIFAKSGAAESDLAALRSAIDACIVYRAATPYFLGTFAINTYSGLSMYLPCAGTPLLDSYYKNEPWNKAVELVK